MELEERNSVIRAMVLGMALTNTTNMPTNSSRPRATTPETSEATPAMLILSSKNRNQERPVNKSNDFQAKGKTSARGQLQHQAVSLVDTTIEKLGMKKIRDAERFKDEKESPVVGRITKPTESMMRKK